jgi:hypothetical protein
VGVINLFFLYLPFFLITFVCLAIAGVAVLTAKGCEGSRGTFKPSFLAVLKLFALNVAIDLVIFIIIGAISKVIVVDIGGIY